MKVAALMAALLLLPILACKSRHSKSPAGEITPTDQNKPNDQNQPDDTKNPVTNIDSMKELPENMVQELKTWLLSPQKSCSIHAIFSAAKDDRKKLDEAYDLSMLLKALNQKLWLTNAAGDTLILTKPFGPTSSGFAHSSSTHNGNTITLGSDLSLDGLCTVQINGKEVARLRVTSGLGVSALIPAGRSIALSVEALNISRRVPLDDNLNLILPDNLARTIERQFLFNPAQARNFSLPGYSLDTLLTRTYEATADQVVFHGKQAYRGWIGPSNSDSLVPLRASWPGSFTMAFVPVIASEEQVLALTTGNPSKPIAWEWTLEFTAWEVGNTPEVFQPMRAEVKVNASMQKNATKLIDLTMTSFSSATMHAVEGDPLSECILNQTALWKEVVAHRSLLTPESTFFPCERLVGSEKKMVLLDQYASNAALQRAFQDILNLMLPPIGDSWLTFDLNLATARGGDAFPFPKSTGFGATWKKYYDFYKTALNHKNALTLSAIALHGSPCALENAALQSFGNSYMAATTASEQQNAIAALRKVCSP